MNPLAIGFALFVLIMAGVLDAGVVVTARRAGFSTERWVRLAIGLTLALDAWLAITILLAWAGVFRSFDRLPPRVPIAVLTAIVVIIALSRTDGFRQLIRACPPSYPIALQGFRVIVELTLWLLYRDGRLPVQMTFEGRNFDVLAGLSAPLMAWAVSRGALGGRAVVAWNLVCLALLANIVVIANTSAPGLLHAGWPGPPSTLIADPPYIWLPAFLVPLAFFGHYVSLLQARASAARANTER